MRIDLRSHAFYSSNNYSASTTVIRSRWWRGAKISLTTNFAIVPAVTFDSFCSLNNNSS